MENLLHTPEGVRDLHDDECEKKQMLEELLRHRLHLFGFRDIVTPTFEFFDIFSKERGTVPSKDMYKFVDREGNTLVLRPDITPQIARCVVRYYQESAAPVRLSYCGNAYVNNSGYRGKLKEMTQIGAELIGDGTVLADAEMVALMAECLKACGLEHFQIEIGHVGFFSALAEEASLKKEEANELRNLIESKNMFSVEQLLLGYEMKPELKELFLKLPELFGNIEKMREVLKLTDNPKAKDAILHLLSLHELLTAYGVEKYISYDLGMLGQYGYYTGINFRALTRKTGESVAAGGRYDQLVGQFGKATKAIGIALYVDLLMLSLERQGLLQNSRKKRTLVLYEKGFECEAIKQADALRSTGMMTLLQQAAKKLTDAEYQEKLSREGLSAIFVVDETGAKEFVSKL